MAKASHASLVRRFTDIPNVGPAMAGDFKLLGIATASELATADPMDLYRRLCEATGARQDPCVLDTFLAVCDFMSGAPSKPWWEYTPVRKARWPDL